MANLRRSLVINFFSSSGAAFLQFIVSVLLARMLSPSEIGVFSMTVVFVNVAHIFRDFGVTAYVQREPDLTVEKMRSAIGVLFASSWLIALLLFACSSWLGAWFQEPGIVPVMRVLALGFFVIPFGSITQSLLIREFAADKQAIVIAASTVAYCVSCLVFAALGFGTMSLAWANLISLVTSALCYIPLRPQGMPWIPSLRHWRGIAHFGVGTLLTNCTAAVNNAIPDILLGKLGSAHHVGLFSRANSTVSIFTHAAGSTINYGAVSYLSQSHHRGESLSPVLSRATALLTGIGWPAYALTALLGKEIVLVLYGATWIESVPAILPLTIAAAVMMMFQYAPAALTAIGLPYLGAIPVALTLLTRIGFGFWLFDGSLNTFAWAICLATLAAAPVMALQQRRHLGYPVRAALGSVRLSALVTLLCVIACLGLKLVLPESIPVVARLLTMALLLAATWYLALRVTRHALLGEVHLLAAGLKSRLVRARVA